MFKLLALFLFVSVNAQAEVLKWDCEDKNVDSSFKVSYNTASKKGNIKLTIAGQTESIRVTSIHRSEKPVATWFYTSQAFMDENVHVGFKITNGVRTPGKKLGKMFYYDVTTGEFLGEDQMAKFICVQK